MITPHLWMAACPAGWRCGFYKDSQEGWTGSWGGSVIIWKRDSGWRKFKEVLEPSLEDLHDPICFMIWQGRERDSSGHWIRKTFSSMETTWCGCGVSQRRLWRKSLEQLGAECCHLPNRFYRWLCPNASVYKYLSSRRVFPWLWQWTMGLQARSHWIGPVYRRDWPPFYAGNPSWCSMRLSILSIRMRTILQIFGRGMRSGLLGIAPLRSARELLDLVAIGTIADMVSLTDEDCILGSIWSGNVGTCFSASVYKKC